MMKGQVAHERTYDPKLPMNVERYGHRVNKCQKCEKPAIPIWLCTSPPSTSVCLIVVAVVFACFLRLLKLYASCASQALFAMRGLANKVAAVVFKKLHSKTMARQDRASQKFQIYYSLVQER